MPGTVGKAGIGGNGMIGTGMVRSGCPGNWMLNSGMPGAVGNAGIGGNGMIGTGMVRSGNAQFVAISHTVVPCVQYAATQYRKFVGGSKWRWMQVQ